MHDETAEATERENSHLSILGRVVISFSGLESAAANCTIIYMRIFIFDSETISVRSIRQGSNDDAMIQILFGRCPVNIAQTHLAARQKSVIILDAQK